jgi:hypothetical protein
MRALASVSFAALGLAGCFDRPDVLVLCHNSNCSEPHDPSRDDTIEAMHDSFAVTTPDGLPAIDGIELDLFRYNGQCLYAHDSDHLDGHVDIRVGMTEVAAYLTTHARASHNGERFNIKLELKPQIDGNSEPVEQVTCALDAFEIMRQAALASGIPVEFVFDSYNPALLREVQDRRPPDEPLIWSKLSIDYGIPRPLRADNYLLEEVDVPIDIAEIHGDWITDPALRALRSEGVGFTVWSFDLTRDTLDQIDRIHPTYALTGQALTLRTWLDR